MLLQTALLVVALSVIGTLIALGICLGLFYFVGKRWFRTIIQRLFGLVLERLLRDKYPENLIPLCPSCATLVFSRKDLPAMAFISVR